jgi:hypothetical protein
MAFAWSSFFKRQGNHSTPRGDADADFDRCSTAEKARGIAHEQAAKYTFATIAILVRTIATAAAIARRLLSSRRRLPIDCDGAIRRRPRSHCATNRMSTTATYNPCAS